MNLITRKLFFSTKANLFIADPEDNHFGVPRREQVKSTKCHHRSETAMVLKLFWIAFQRIVEPALRLIGLSGCCLRDNGNIRCYGK